jgi:hypothetical protein
MYAGGVCFSVLVEHCAPMGSLHVLARPLLSTLLDSTDGYLTLAIYPLARLIISISIARAHVQTNFTIGEIWTLDLYSVRIRVDGSHTNAICEVRPAKRRRSHYH